MHPIYTGVDGDSTPVYLKGVAVIPQMSHRNPSDESPQLLKGVDPTPQTGHLSDVIQLRSWPGGGAPVDSFEGFVRLF